jgi:hypothetical protein
MRCHFTQALTHLRNKDEELRITQAKLQRSAEEIHAITRDNEQLRAQAKLQSTTLEAAENRIKQLKVRDFLC